MHRALTAVACAAVVLVAGCGSDLEPVAGVVANGRARTAADHDAAAVTDGNPARPRTFPSAPEAAAAA